MFPRFKTWWATPHSSVITHRLMKWGWVALWVAAESIGFIDSVSFISRLSLVALILGSWSAEEAAQAKEENANASTTDEDS